MRERDTAGTRCADTSPMAVYRIPRNHSRVGTGPRSTPIRSLGLFVGALVLLTTAVFVGQLMEAGHGSAAGAHAALASNAMPAFYGEGTHMAADPVGGYWTVDGSGSVSPHNGATFLGSPASAGQALNQPIVGMAATPSGQGYWLVASDGGIFSYGDAGFYGSTGAIHLNKPIVGMAATPSGLGYWLVASDGGIFSYGDAAFYGSTGAIHLNKPIVGMTPTTSGQGYWLVASDGGIFSYGDAAFFGSTGAIQLNQPIVGMAPTPSGLGYWLVASDGGIFSYGDAGFYGSTGGLGVIIIGIIVHVGTPGYGLIELNGQEVVLPPGALPTISSSPTTTTTSSTAPTTTSTTFTGVPGVANCGGAGPSGMPGGNWSCIFDDEFDGSSLDTSKWVVQQTDNSGYTTGTDPDRACYVDNVNTVSVSGGDLHLSIQKASTPFTCNDPQGSFTTGYSAGMVSTDNLFSQTYGAFEVSAELPPSVVAGLQETLWLWPQNASTYGSTWPSSGEIDFGEFYSDFPTFDVPYVHYVEASSDPEVTGDCVINPVGFNTYGVDWQPGSIAIYLNGVQCLVDHPDPASPLVSPEPFDQPFFLVLTQAIGFGSNTPLDGVTQFPSTTLVDWARAWQG